MNDLIYPLRQRESPLLTLKGSLVTGPGHHIRCAGPHGQRSDM